MPAVLIDSIIVGFEISYFFMGTLDLRVLFANAISVMIGQAVVCYGLGVPLLIVLEKNNFLKKMIH